MDTIIIPVHFEISQTRRVDINPDQIEELAFADIVVKAGSDGVRITEPDLEEFVRKKIQHVFPQETLLIVGKQVRNKEGGRSDLVPVDAEGNVVLIELKRDRNDLTSRKEALEFQAI